MHFRISQRQQLVLVPFFLASVAFGASSATQTVTFSVTPISELSVSGNPAAMTVATAAAGAAPNSVTDSSTRYAITTNGADRKISAALDTALPEGVILRVRLAAPAGAASAGAVALGTTAADVVTGISTLNETGKEITFELSAAADAGVVISQTRTVTLTVTAGPM